MLSTPQFQADRERKTILNSSLYCSVIFERSYTSYPVLVLEQTLFSLPFILLSLSEPQVHRPPMTTASAANFFLSSEHSFDRTLAVS